MPALAHVVRPLPLSLPCPDGSDLGVGVGDSAEWAERSVKEADDSNEDVLLSSVLVPEVVDDFIVIV